MSRTPALAIVGMACRLPSAVNDPDDFWNVMTSGGNGIVDVPEERWSARKFSAPNTEPGVARIRRGGFLQGYDPSAFDFGFFGISAREAEYMDPQQRLLLEVAWEALEDAGVARSGRLGERTGVFMGGFTTDYAHVQFAGGRAGRANVSSHTSTGMVMTMLSNRISHALDLTGPSLTIDTACSSSLVALDAAASAVAQGQCDSALVGGVNLMLSPNFTIAASHGGFLSPSSQSRPFHADADGYVRSEGASVIAIKPLEAAERDGDDIHAVILATGVNQDGHTNGITVPSATAQAELMQRVVEKAGISASDIDYVQAHGTGTAVGDPIETSAIGSVYGSGSGRSNPVLVTSMKGQFGHLEAAAGISGLVYAALCLKRALVPGTPVETLNPGIHTDEWGLDIPASHRDLATDRPRYAAVNSFGFGGTNAHAVLMSAPALQSNLAEPKQLPGQWMRPIVVASARSEGALRTAAARLGDLVEAGNSPESVAARSWRHDAHYSERIAVHATSSDALTAALRNPESLEAENGATVIEGSAEGISPDSLCFVYTGMGPQWWGMARDLMTQEESFRATIEEIDTYLTSEIGVSIREELLRDEADSRMHKTAYSQPANFAIQVALTRLLRSWGVSPNVIIGHSAGEPAAAWASGALTLADATKVIAHRARLQATTAGQGRLAAVGLPRAEVEALPWVATGPLEIAAENDAASVAVAGPLEALEDMCSSLTAGEVFTRLVNGDVPYHSAAMDPLHDDLIRAWEGIEPLVPLTPWVSTVSGTLADSTAHGAHYWWENVRCPVEFRSALAEAIDQGARVFVEIGPAPTLRRSILKVCEDRGVDGRVLATLNPAHHDDVSLADTLAGLFVAGHPPTVDGMWGSADRAGLPGIGHYPWDRTPGLWVEAADSLADRLGYEVDDLLGHPVEGPGLAWRRSIDRSLPSYLLDHRVGGVSLVPGAMLVAISMAAAKNAYGVDGVKVENVTFHHTTALNLAVGAEMETRLNRSTGDVRIFSRPSFEGEWVLAATARVRRRERNIGTQTAPSLSGSALDHEALYASFAELGFDYGPQFRLIEELTVEGDQVVGKVDAEQVQPTRDLSGVADPALIDAAFQLLLPFAAQWATEDSSFLPTGVDSVTVSDRLVRGPLHASARVSLRTQDEIAADAWLTDDAGNVIVDVRSFRARRVSATSIERADDRWLYHVEWVPAERANSSASTDTLVLLASPGSSTAQSLREAVEANGRPCAVTDVDNLATALASDGSVSVADVRALDLPEHTDRPDIAAREIDGAALQVISDLSRMERGIPFTMVTVAAVPLGGRALNSRALSQAGLWGLVRTLHQESAALSARLVDVDDLSPEAIHHLGRELACPDSEDQVALQERERLVARLTPTEDLPSMPVSFDSPGTRLVTGGLGALGTLFVKWLADRGAAHIVITTQSPIADEDTWDDIEGPRGAALRQVRDLRASGIEVLIEVVNVTDESSIRAMVERLDAAGLPPVRSIFHTAGRVMDTMLAVMDRATLDAVAAPKVTGAWNLHSVFGDSLEHFVMFSSVSSVVVTAGQANYAAANSFMDTLAHARASAGMNAQTWNWGPWAIGMIEQLQLEDSFARRGIDLVAREKGLEIADQLIGSDSTQQVVVCADWTKVVAAYAMVPTLVLHLAEDDSDDSDVDDALARILAAPTDERLAMVSEVVAQVVATTLRMPMDKLSHKRPLSGLGLDSIVGVELRVRLERVFGVAPSLVFLLQEADIAGVAERITDALAESDDIDLDEALGEFSDDELGALLDGLDRVE